MRGAAAVRKQLQAQTPSQAAVAQVHGCGGDLMPHPDAGPLPSHALSAQAGYSWFLGSGALRTLGRVPAVVSFEAHAGRVCPCVHYWHI